MFRFNYKILIAVLFIFYGNSCSQTSTSIQEKQKKVAADNSKKIEKKKYDQIIIKFKYQIADSVMKSLEKEFGMKKIEVISGINSKVFRLDSKKDVTEMIKLLEKKEFIEYAEPNVIVKILKK
jgi:hypothetical protein